jgi:hypothetical protein
MVNLFKKKPKSVKETIINEHNIINDYDDVIKLPVKWIDSILDFYTDSNFKNEDKIKVGLVAIYNVKQLAFEIAEYLKNNTNDRGESHNKDDGSPKP